LNLRNLIQLSAWLLVGLSVGTPLLGAQRLTLNFNPDWKFIKADPPRAQEAEFDDRPWTNVSLPHTYNDIDSFDNFSPSNHRGEQGTWGGRTAYRKYFVAPDSWRGKEVFIEFQGVRQIAEVYLNGKLLGVSKTGFTPFGFNLTPGLNIGQTNVLAVICDNSFRKDPQSEGEGLAKISAAVNAAIPENVADLRADQIPWNNPHWHPAHGGIYRDVRVYVTDPLHIPLPLYSFLQTAGSYVYATDISEKSAAFHCELPAQNDRTASADASARIEVFDHDGNRVLILDQQRSIASGATQTFNFSGVIQNPRLWEPDYPQLYRVVCSLLVKGEVVDSTEISLGIRTASWNVSSGFSINGQHLKLRGWGQKPTDEWPGLGAAQPDWLHFYTLNLMKDAGANWVRWGHCAAGPSLIAACDELGLMVEQPGVDGESDTRGAAWKVRADAFRDTLIYFRNSPSIMIWEGGNQKVSLAHVKELRGLMDKWDPHGARAYAHRRADAIDAQFMDVGIGTEGGREIANLPVVEGEYDREESPRRVWDDFSPPNFGYREAKGQAYDLTSEQYAVNEVAQYIQKLGAPNHSGGANWIFSDSTSGGRDAAEVARASGEVDGVRLPKEAYYVCRTLFRDDPQIHIIGHWTYSAETKKNIYVTANTSEVELFLNGKSLGHGKKSDNFLFTFQDVQWEPGELKAAAYQSGQAVATDSIRTAGAPVALKLTSLCGPDGLLADGSDIGLVDVEAVDANGQRCPTVQKRIDFALAGPAIWRGGYNSGKAHSINQTFLDLECGINRISLRSTRQPGAIKLTASCDGLQPASIVINSKSFVAQYGFTPELPKMPPIKLQENRTHSFPSITSAQPFQAPISIPNSHYLVSFSYSGPTSKVHVESDAENGKSVYVDRNFQFADLPSPLTGADWIQAAQDDHAYDALDLIELAPKSGASVFIAHDDVLSPPAWLLKQFEATKLTLNVNGRTMRIFEHKVKRGESLTLGSESSATRAADANMYFVLVKGGS
jgi:beta-galactosidase